MFSKNQQKFILSLSQKKYRDESGFFVVEGVKGVEEVLRSSLEIDQIWASAEWKPSIEMEVITKRCSQLSVVKEADFARLSMQKSPNKVLAIAKIPESKLPVLKGHKVLALDGINDPGNLGTLIRIADWFNIDAVVCGDHTADCWAPKTVQSAMGSLFRMPVIYKNLSEIFELADQSQVPIWAAEMYGKSVYELNTVKEGILLMGSESHGIRTRHENMKSITIPGGGGAESLNVGVACGIICSRLFAL